MASKSASGAYTLIVSLVVAPTVPLSKSTRVPSMIVSSSPDVTELASSSVSLLAPTIIVAESLRLVSSAAHLEQFLIELH